MTGALEKRGAVFWLLGLSEIADTKIPLLSIVDLTVFLTKSICFNHHLLSIIFSLSLLENDVAQNSIVLKKI